MQAEEVQCLEQHRQHNPHSCQDRQRRSEHQQPKQEPFHRIARSKIGACGAQRDKHPAQYKHADHSDHQPTAGDLHAAIALRCRQYLWRHVRPKRHAGACQKRAHVCGGHIHIAGAVGIQRAALHSSIKPVGHAAHVAHDQVDRRPFVHSALRNHVDHCILNQHRLDQHPDRQDEQRRNGGEHRGIIAIVIREGVQLARIARNRRHDPAAYQTIGKDC